MIKYKKRVREINYKSSSLSGQISSRKLNQPVQFESSLERDFIYLLEFDRTIDSYLEQPLEIFYKDLNGVIRKYTPDFIISYSDKFRKNEVIEVKYNSELIEKEKELEVKFEAARNYCKKNNLLFRVCTDHDIRDEKGVLLRNFKFLSRYRDYFDNINYEATGIVFDTSYGLMIIDKVAEKKNCTINEMINSITKDKYKRAELIFLTWCLIANNFIDCDFYKWLNLESKVWID